MWRKVSPLSHSPFLGSPFNHSYSFAFRLIGMPFWLQSSFTLGTVVASYVPPVPLKGTGFSREVVVLLEQSAGLDTQRLNIDNTLEGTPSKNIGLRIQLNFKLFWTTIITLLKDIASLGLLMKFKTSFMSDEEKHSHHFDLPPFFNMSKQSLAPGGLSAECVQVSVM